MYKTGEDTTVYPSSASPSTTRARGTRYGSPNSSDVARHRPPHAAAVDSLKKQEKRKSITKAGRMRCTPPDGGVRRIQYYPYCVHRVRQRGATNISFTNFIDSFAYPLPPPNSNHRVTFPYCTF